MVTTGFANLSDGSKVVIGRDDQTPAADLAPRKRTRAPQAKDVQKDGQKDAQKDGQKDAQKGGARPAQGADQSGTGAKQP